MKLNYRQRLLATTLLVGAGFASPAFAQDQTTPPGTEGTATDVTQPSGPVEGQPTPTTSAEGENVEQAQDIVVTGTRIPQPNLESSAPVTVVTSQDLKLQGATRVEDLLNTLPSVVANQSSNLANGASGTAEIDLRGLGPKRNLVLLNGRRLVPGDPFSASVADVNFVPASLVKRVDVLTGGASSTYGADAVAGVTNFIMDTNFTGIRFDGTYSFYQHSNRNNTIRGPLEARQDAGFSGYNFPRGQTVDGGQFDGTVSLGTAFADDKGHAVVYFGYRKARPILQSKRDYSACTIQEVGQTGIQCGGSGTAAPGNAFVYVPTTFTTKTANGATVTVNTFTSSRFAFDGQGGGAFGANRYNFAPTNYFQRPDERYTAGLFANYEISDQIKPYLEFMFMDDRSVAQIAPSGDFGNTYTVNCDNPLLQANTAAFSAVCAPYNLVGTNPATGQPFFNGVVPIVTGTSGTPAYNFIDPITGATYNQGYFNLFRRNVEGGPRQADLQHTSFRGVLGTRGDLNNVWAYDAYYQYGRTNYQQTYSNEFSIATPSSAHGAFTP